MNTTLETVRKKLYFRKIKERNGITLISLVITIIILLILAGITISQLTGNGLFEKANEAKEKSLRAEAKEDIILAIYEIQMDYQKNGKILERDNLNQELLEEKNKNISRYGEIDTYSGIYQKGKQSIKFTIKEDLSVIIEEDLEINNDIRKWLQYANLDNKYNYTKIDEVLLDDACMQELFNSKEAVDYMTTNNEIINAIAQNKNSIKLLGESEYALDVIKNDKIKDIILGSVYIDEFDESSIKIPILTDNTSNGIVTGSSLYSGAYQLYYPFTQGEPSTTSGTNIWCPRPYNNSWIAYEFNIEKDINIYKLKFNSYAEKENSSRWFFPKKYVLQCKINDGDDGEMSNWVDCSPIYELSDITLEGELVTNISENNKWYTVTNYFNSNVYGKKFRLYVYESYGSDLVINRLQIYGRE